VLPCDEGALPSGPVRKMLYIFEGYALDTDRRELRRGDAAVALQPQVFDLLEYLIRNRDRVVDKDDLLASVWGGRIVSESTLTSRINAARTAIGDTGEDQRLIRTLRHKGFRFIGAVREEQESAIASGRADAVAPMRELPLPERPSIAVLPFANMSGDPEQEYFADGITEDIITALSKWRWFFVIARNSSFTYKGRSVDVRQIGRELGVRYLLEGSIRKTGNRIRLSAQLIEVTNGVHLWAERFDRELTDVFAIQDELTQRVAAAIGPALSRIETERAKHKTPEQMAAWDHYLRGMWYFHQFGKDMSAEALTSFKRAIELDESLADAHTGIARTLLSRTMYRAFAERRARMSQVLKAAKDALSLDGENVGAFYALSLASSHNDDVEAGFQFAQRAVELNDNFAPAYFALAVANLYLGRSDDSLVAIDRALRLSPSDPQAFVWYSTKASALYLLRRYADAVESARQSLRLNRYHTALRVLAASYAQLDTIDKAREVMRELMATEYADKTIAAVIKPFQRVADRESYSEGLSKAGMPEI